MYEAVLGYICKIKIHAAKGQNLEDKVLSLLDSNLGQNHIYQAIFKQCGISWNIARQKGKSCGTVMTNKGHSTWTSMKPSIRKQSSQHSRGKVM